MRKLLTIIIINCYLLVSCNNSSIDKSVKDMSDYNMFEYKFTGLADDSSLQWARYETILANSSETELSHLCDNESAVVRSYAFQGLVEKKSALVFDVLTKHLHDGGEFERIMGCFVDPCYVTDFYLEQVGYFPYHTSSYSISSLERALLDSLMLFGPEIELRKFGYNQIRFKSRDYMLEHLTHRETYYNRLKEIVLAGVIEALPALAKFKNPNDISLIKTVFENEGLFAEDYVYNAIANFPHPDLFSIINKQVMLDLIHESQFDSTLYKGLLQFKTQKSREVLRVAIEKFKKQNRRNDIDKIKDLLDRYQDKMFTGLF